MNDLVIKNLHAGIDGRPILKGVNLTIKPGKITALMGPNGSGKSTLSHILMGHPTYEVTKGNVRWGKEDVLKMEVWNRARAGLFLSFQYPYEIPGVNLYEFLLTAYKSIHGEAQEKIDAFDKNLSGAIKDLKLPNKFLARDLNAGFSGGEKKKTEILQLKVLQPKIAILDETDSGLDIDALKLIAENVQKMKSPDIGFLVITHYQRLLNHLKPDEVHVMMEGKIVKSGGPELVKRLEKDGYEWLGSE